MKKIPIEKEEHKIENEEYERESVLNPFKPSFWTISGLEKAKNVLEAF